MRTSVNLILKDVNKIIDVCDRIGLCHSFLFNECLRRYFAQHHSCLKTSRIKRLVEYQPKGAGYCILNVVFDVDVYNLAVNFRVFSRFSVSLMLTKALAEFLDEVVAKIEGKQEIVHNYVDYIHLMRHNDDHNRPEWQILWVVEGKQTPD